jgi:hypothetical protein
MFGCQAAEAFWRIAQTMHQGEFAVISRLGFQWFALPFMLICAPLVRAANFCVTDVATLKGAMQQAAGNGEDNDIRLVKGTYSFLDALFYDGQSHKNLRLLGGYDAGCVSRVLAPANTIFDGAAAPTQQMLFNARGGDIVIEGIRWTHFTAANYSAIHLQQLDTRGKLVFRLNEVDHNTSQAQVLQLTGIGEIELNSNLVHDNAATDTVLVDGTQILRGARIVHNTIASNNGGGLYTQLSWSFNPVALYNNVLYGNATRDLRVAVRAVYALNNTVGVALSSTPTTYASGSSDNNAVNPQLTANFAPAPGSPAINGGVPFSDVLLAQDVLGIKRYYGSAPDRGAIEAVNSDLSVFTVTNTNDSGNGSLRDAINQANLSGGPSSIKFQIGASCGPQVIAPGTLLPDIKVPLIIDGYTQPGAHVNTLNGGFDGQLCIFLLGNATTNFGLRVSSGSSNGRLDLRGLLFSNFSNYAVALADGKGHHIQGNSFGVATPGSGAVFPNGSNVVVYTNANAAVVGGASVAERNLIGAANGVTGFGINLGTADSFSVVRNNYVGTTADGLNAASNTGGGINVQASGHNQIIGNLVSGNGGSGIAVKGNALSNLYTVIRDNRIGLNRNAAPLGNNVGVLFTAGASNNVLGSSYYNDFAGANEISGNLGTGVWVESSAGTGNAVVNNLIGSNGGLPVDLGSTGVLANDALDADSGANNLQNKPVLTLAQQISPYRLHIEGSLQAKPNSGYYVNFYASAACDGGFGPAETPLGGVLLGTDAAGAATFSVNLGDGVPTDGVATAIATSTSLDSSEVSACQGYIRDYLFQNDFEAPIL